MEKDVIYVLDLFGVHEWTTEMIEGIKDYEVYNIENLKYGNFIILNDEQALFYKLHSKETLTPEQVYSMQLSPIEERINLIREKREELYRKESDSLYIAYVKYTTLGETEKAEAKHQEWLEKLQEIKDNNPYPTE